MSIKENSPKTIRDITPALFINKIKQTKLLKSDFKSSKNSPAQKRTNIFINMQGQRRDSNSTKNPAELDSQLGSFKDSLDTS